MDSSGGGRRGNSVPFRLSSLPTQFLAAESMLQLAAVAAVIIFIIRASGRRTGGLTYSTSSLLR